MARGFAVETHKLTREFGEKRAVDTISIRVPKGEIFGFLGLNGAGKSTTIKMLTTLLPPTAGRARVLGHDVVREPLQVRRNVGLLGEEGGVEAKPHWTAREYLGYFAGIQRAGGRREVEDLLEFMGLEQEARRRRLGTLSTGMKRRVEVARAFIGRPSVLFLDEPSRGLDLPSKKEMWAFFRHLCKQERVTVFLSSHETGEIQALCRSLAVISKGRLVFNGPAGQLGKDPALFEAALVRLLKGPDAAKGPAAAKTFEWTR